MIAPTFERACAQCGKGFRPYRDKQRFCCDACRNRAFRDERAALVAKAKQLIERERGERNGQSEQGKNSV